MPNTSIFLLVEDDENDVLIIKRAFHQAKVLNPVMVVQSGAEAILYLQGQGVYSNRAEFPLPSLVLLDLNMPGISGFDVLEWIRDQPSLRGLRVVVLSASDSMRDVNRAYHLGANSFLIKPVDFERFVEVSQALSGYWLWMSAAPDVSRPPLTPPEPEKTSAEEESRPPKPR